VVRRYAIILFIYLFYYGEGGPFLARASFFTEEEGAVVWRTLAFFCCFEVAFFFFPIRRRRTQPLLLTVRVEMGLSLFFLP
jgi:hypothetical protein